MKLTLLLLLLVFVSAASAAVTKSTSRLRLGETEVRVNVYQNPAGEITFFAPHFNEQLGIRVAREFVAARGGRLIEIENYDSKGIPSRLINFSAAGRIYSVDPNRIFTENGRNCGLPPEIRPAVAEFAAQMLGVIFDIGQEAFRTSGRPLIAVHNNADVESKTSESRPRDLTAFAFLNEGPYAVQAAGAFISNAEDDPDNFVFLSTPEHIGYFGSFGFNVVVQRPATSLASGKCSIDDGSLSVYSSLNNVPYICLEADAATGELRQRQMFEAVYQLLPQSAVAKQ